MEIKEILKDKLISGENYLVYRVYGAWSIARHHIDREHIRRWDHQDGLSDTPLKIYELPILNIGD